ncbi:MAG TPA: 7-carboxy-7-deazaguanine synthase QueE [Desulfomonilia bacterium]
MKIIEIFPSIQGEGPWTGRPCTFIRLAGCVRPYCSWCDTRYALSGGEEMPVKEVLSRIKELERSSVVITGGEPFIQKDEVVLLHEALVESGFSVQYETSGKAGIPDLKSAFIVLSPKRPGRKWLIDKTDIKKADCFKFVYDSAKTGRSIRRFIRDNGIDVSRVYIMPEGQTKEDQIAMMPEVFEFCISNGFMMTPRLHVLCWGDKRGI